MMNQHHSIAMKAEEHKSNVPISITPSRIRASASSKSKIFPKNEVLSGLVSVSPTPRSRRAISVPPRDYCVNNGNGNSVIKANRRSLLLSKAKSGEESPAVVGVGSQKDRKFDDVKAVNRFLNQAVVESYARPIRQRSSESKNLRKINEVDLVDGDKKKLEEKLDQSESLIRELKHEVLELKDELGRRESLNVELHELNKKLSEDLAAAEAKIAALSSSCHQREFIAEQHTSKFKDIQKLIANKLENSVTKKDVIVETTIRDVHSTSVKSPGLDKTDLQSKIPECPSTPPPPPPLPPRRPAKMATSRKASPVVELYQSLVRPDARDSFPGGNKQISSSAHNSIVGEIQNRSSHLLAIKSDIETKGEFVNGLIQKVLVAAYSDIEDVLTFVDWLDNELSSLADERAVLRNFKWPEKKADAMREAAVEYRSLKLLESEVSSYQDDIEIPCGIALKKMASLLDKSERSIQRLIKLRNSVMLCYREHNIPTDWMLDSGIVTKIKQASRKLAKTYMKRVTFELESIRYSERESTQEALLLQGVHFAYRAHQFSGGLDSETLCAFEEIRQRVPGHIQGSRQLFAAIPSS